MTRKLKNAEKEYNQLVSKLETLHMQVLGVWPDDSANIDDILTAIHKHARAYKEAYWGLRNEQRRIK